MHQLQFNSELITTLNGRRVGHHKHIELLENIQRFGSITQAAKAIPMSYKAAWDAINQLNKLAPEPLVIRHIGGQGGGQSTLTTFGKNFVHEYRRIQNQHQQIMQQLHHSVTITPSLVQPPIDNQLTATIDSLIRGSINHEIQLQLTDQLSLIAQIPAEHSQQLALTEGLAVFVLIQASAIILAKPAPQLAISARNQLAAQVKQLHLDAVNGLVECDLGHDLSLNVLITRASVHHMALKVGDPIILLIKAPNILLGRL